MTEFDQNRSAASSTIPSSVRIVFLLLALLATVAGIALSTLWNSNPLRELKDGAYQGIITGLSDDVPRTAFAFWKQDRAMWILLGKEGCSASPLASDGSFSCGNEQFIWSSGSHVDDLAIGTVRQVKTNKVGLWFLSSLDKAKLAAQLTFPPGTGGAGQR